ncbi:MAG TPA: hypothetical protein VM305_09325 [Candidatus Limnocylindrales bacterium]|nr:hypothetical protein [Candidatus Limnocylindrales bacterium]
MVDQISADRAGSIRKMVDDGLADAELAALLWLLGDHGVPLVLASREPLAADVVASALPGVSGTLAAESLDEVARLGGGSAAHGLPDELRDLGIVIVVRQMGGIARIAAAHYVRPLERDAGGHVQRRGPAVLAVYDQDRESWEHFAWGVEAELAERAGLTLRELDEQRRVRLEALVGRGPAG